MNKLSEHKRMALNMLVEGSSMRSVSRIVGISINTVTKLLVDAGTACERIHNERVRDVDARRVQCDGYGPSAMSRGPSRPGRCGGCVDLDRQTAIEADYLLVHLPRPRLQLIFMDDLRTAGLACSNIHRRPSGLPGGHRGGGGDVDYGSGSDPSVPPGR